MNKRELIKNNCRILDTYQYHEDAALLLMAENGRLYLSKIDDGPDEPLEEITIKEWFIEYV